MNSKVIKVKKTDNSWKTPDGSKTLYTHLVRMENGDQGWTFSEKFVDGEEIEYDKIESKKNVDNEWYDYKLNPIKKEFGTGFTKSPETQKSIVRQHSQEMALRHFEIQVTLNKIQELSFTDVMSMADQYEKDAMGTVETVSGTGTWAEKAKDLGKAVAEKEEDNFDDIPF